ncbi:MAG: hypothetical protein C5B49_08160 [Bdellovibrio sp.]|nr:MAG: hypothetical protein C5B49_08160 [Bdellovibrio sp.]
MLTTKLPIAKLDVGRMPMIYRFAIPIFAVFSPVCYADKVTLDILAKDIFVKGAFAFQPGNSIKISGKDVAGKPYEIELSSKVQKDDGIQFTCKLTQEGHKRSVSIVTKKGLEGVVTSGPDEGPPDLKLGANWTE